MLKTIFWREKNLSTHKVKELKRFLSITDDWIKGFYHALWYIISSVESTKLLEKQRAIIKVGNTYCGKFSSHFALKTISQSSVPDL